MTSSSASLDSSNFLPARRSVRSSSSRSAFLNPWRISRAALTRPTTSPCSSCVTAPPRPRPLRTLTFRSPLRRHLLSPRLPPPLPRPRRALLLLPLLPHRLRFPRQHRHPSRADGWALVSRSLRSLCPSKEKGRRSRSSAFAPFRLRGNFSVSWALHAYFLQIILGLL